MRLLHLESIDFTIVAMMVVEIYASEYENDKYSTISIVIVNVQWAFVMAVVDSDPHVDADLGIRAQLKKKKKKKSATTQEGSGRLMQKDRAAAQAPTTDEW